MAAQQQQHQARPPEFSNTRAISHPQVDHDWRHQPIQDASWISLGLNSGPMSLDSVPVPGLNNAAFNALASIGITTFPQLLGQMLVCTAPMQNRCSPTIAEISNRFMTVLNGLVPQAAMSDVQKRSLTVWTWHQVGPGF